MATISPPIPTLTPSTPGLRARARKRHVGRWIKRGAIIAISGGIIAALVIASLPKPVSVEVAIAHRAMLETEVAEAGRTRVRDRYLVASPIGGTLDRIELVAGDPIARGQIVARVRPATSALLDPRSADEASARLSSALARQQQAATGIERATIARDAAVNEAIRGRILAGRGAIAAAERERLELAERMAIADRASAALERDAATAAVTSARATLGGGRASDRVLEVTSPIAGRVLEVVRESGGPIAAGSPMLAVGDPRALEVVVDVLSIDAARTTPGMPVEITSWGDDRILRGSVRAVEPSGFTRISALGVEEQRVHVIVDLADPPPALGDGFRVEARIVTWRADVLVVPASAVFRTTDGWALYRVEGDRARRTTVTIGHRGRLDVEIAGGLNAADRVVLHPSDRVVDGVEVAPLP